MTESQPLVKKVSSWTTFKPTALIDIQEVFDSTSSSQACSSTSFASSSVYSNAAGDMSPSPKAETEQVVRRSTLNCPVAQEFQQARQHCPVLASTGCTKDFCQAGRAVHTDEPRVGENRAIDVVEREAQGFLEELHREGFFESDEAFDVRLKTVLTEIRSAAAGGIVRDGQEHGVVGGNWEQSAPELQFGIRRAWRNARKCIMRSHCEELKLCDLRHLTSSADMATGLLTRMCEAFNGGNVLPTVFVLPPRRINSRGPMIWNHQVLEFAGYETDDGSVLGDPNSVHLTKAIIDLGWEPPSPKSRWDLLPLVVMADDDIPAMIEIPPELGKLVKIRHPQYRDQFEELDLRWISVPALTRLGFDIGGVQYTAAPFIGWFMDAEIGVRDLADTFRYNVLPDVAKASGLLDGKLEDGVEGLDDLPEFERLAILSRAQSELTYATYWSYQQAKVSMSDTLTASIKWCRYDDDFKAKNGYRLPADPYWLAPPQGSIVPVWHRGGAPNYQPKPMISRHVQDSLKAWEREKQLLRPSADRVHLVSKLYTERPRVLGRSITDDCLLSAYTERQVQGSLQLTSKHPVSDGGTSCENDAPTNKVVELCREQQYRPRLSVSVYFCSAGTFAEKIANKLHDRVRALSQASKNINLGPRIETLNNFQPSRIEPDLLVLVVVSSTGQGEVPINGARFVQACDAKLRDQNDQICPSFRYAVYGNGDSRYPATFNGAANTVEGRFRKLGGLPFPGGYYEGDTALQKTPLQAINPWWTKLQPTILDLATKSPKLKRANTEYPVDKTISCKVDDDQMKAKAQIVTRCEQLVEDFHSASIVNVVPSPQKDHHGTYHATLNIRQRSSEDMSCIQVLPVNSPAKVRRALRALNVNGSATVEMDIPQMEGLTYSAFFTEYVDLELPFHHLDWLDDSSSRSSAAIDKHQLKSQPSIEALDFLHVRGLLPSPSAIIQSLCLALPLLQPRTYSVASSQSYISSVEHSSRTIHPMLQRDQSHSNNHLDILVKALPLGRFSHTFLSSPTPSPLRYRLLPSSASALLGLPPATPLVIIATGAGFAPVQCLLQRRIAASRHLSSQCTIQNSRNEGISLLLGLKPVDIPLFSPVLNEAASQGVLSSLSIVPSNEEKVRVYDKLREDDAREELRDRVLRKGGWVFVCTNADAARETRGVMEGVLGEGSVEGMGERWVEEVF